MVGIVLGSRMVRGRYADGTGMVWGFKKDTYSLTFEGPGRLNLTCVSGQAKLGVTFGP